MKLIKQADLKRRMVVLVTALAAVATGLVLARIHRRTPMDGVRAAEGGG